VLLAELEEKGLELYTGPLASGIKGLDTDYYLVLNQREGCTFRQVWVSFSVC
jgi:hypothetical protein